MTTKAVHKVSSRSVKRKFSKVGLFLIMYALFALLIPYALDYYLISSNSEILKDDIFYYGIFFIVILFGTLVPFFLMRKTFDLSLDNIGRSVSSSFTDLFVQTIVCFTLCIAFTYVSVIIFSRFGIDGQILCSIGFSYNETNLTLPLYVFIVVIVTPFIEEYAFRGVLLNSLSRYGKRFALYTSAFFFAIAHMNVVEYIPAFVMGYLLGKISMRYKSIVPTILIHMLFNIFLYVLFIIPPSIAQYTAYVLVGIIAIAAYLTLTGRYQRIRIQSHNSNRVAFKLFFSRASVIIATMLMILHTFLYMYL